MKTLIGIVTFGNLPFTQLTVNEIRRTVKSPFKLFVVVGKPEDRATYDWLADQGNIDILWHRDTNRGFPASLNDVLDYAWKERSPTHPLTDSPTHAAVSESVGKPVSGYDNLILCANDVLPYPGAIDALIETAARTDYEWICATKFDARALVAMYPEAREFFKGDGYLFDAAAALGMSRAAILAAVPEPTATRPWDLHAAHVAATASGITPGFPDVAELTLYKRSVFERFGYFDANFWPNGYYFDNDAARRAVNLQLRGCGVTHAVYFHFWSRTIHQGEARPHGTYFERNAEFYRRKWGGDWEHESWKVPFNGAPLTAYLRSDIVLPAALRISDRKNEAAIIEYWRSL